MGITEHVQSLLKENAEKVQDGIIDAMRRDDYPGFVESLLLYGEFKDAMLKEYHGKGFRNQVFMPDDPEEQAVVEEIYRALGSCPLPPGIGLSAEKILFYGGYGRLGTAELSLEVYYSSGFKIEPFLVQEGISYPLESSAHRLYGFRGKFIYTASGTIGHPFFTKWTKDPDRWAQ